MPLYEYRCDACGGVFEVIQKFSDEPLASHAGCGGRVERLLSAAALQFKGAGWYVNDYGRKGKSNGSSEKGDSGDSKSASKTESKPASKSGADAAKPAAAASKDK
jgi:putative FmdB family regulatory protein